MEHRKAVIIPEPLQYPVAEDDGNSVEDDTFAFRPVSLTVMFALLFLTASLLNTLFLIIFLRKPSLRNISNRFIVSLTISNLTSAWIALPLVIVDIFLKDLENKDLPSSYLNMYSSANMLCTSFNVAADFSISASVFSTVLIAFDRFIAITDPLHYHMLVTKCRSCLLIALGWFLSTLVAVFSGIIGDGHGKWSVCETMPDSAVEGVHYWSHLSFGVSCFLVCFVIPLFIISWTYAKIYSAAHQNSERARRSSTCSHPTLEVIESSKSLSRSSSTKSTSSQIVSTIRRRISNASLFLYKEEARAAKISVGVVILFLVCWLPYYFTKFIYAALGTGTLPPYVFKVVLMFSLTNSAISPYVYIYRSRRIKREVLKLFGFSTKTKRPPLRRKGTTVYYQLHGNLERIPASPICVQEGNFKLETPSRKDPPGESKELASSTSKKPSLFVKLFGSARWIPSSIISSSCTVALSLSSASTSSSIVSKSSSCCGSQNITDYENITEPFNGQLTVN